MRERLAAIQHARVSGLIPGDRPGGPLWVHEHPSDGDKEGDHVVHPRRIGAGASNCSPIAVLTRPGSSTFAVTARPGRVSSPACAPPTLWRSPALGRWRECPPRGCIGCPPMRTGGGRLASRILRVI